MKASYSGTATLFEEVEDFFVHISVKVPDAARRVIDFAGVALPAFANISLSEEFVESLGIVREERGKTVTMGCGRARRWQITHILIK